MSKAVTPRHYSVVKHGNNIVFTYKKAKLSFRTYLSLVWPSLILGIFLAYQTVIRNLTLTTPTEKLSMGIFYTIVYTVFIPLAVTIILNLLRQPASFSFTKAGLAVKGTTYPYAEIERLYTKAPSGRTSQPVTVGRFSTAFAYGSDRDFNMMVGTTVAFTSAVSGAVSAATWLSRLSGQEFVKSIQKVSHKVCFRHNGVEKKLAAGLSEKQAFELLHGIKSALEA